MSGSLRATVPGAIAASSAFASARSRRRQPHLGDQAALGACLESHRAAVRGGHGSHDRQAHPRAGPAGRRRAPSRWNGSSRAAAASAGTRALRCSRPARPAVPPSLPTSISTKPRRWLWITAFSARFQTSCSSSRRSPATTAGAHAQLNRQSRAAAASRPPRRQPHGQLRQVHALVALDHAGLAAGERRAGCRSGPGSAAPRSPITSPSAPQVLGARLRVGQRHLELGAHHGQGRAQLVRRVRHESPLARERRLEAVEHVVEGLGQLAQLVVGTARVRCAGRASPRSRPAAAATMSRSGPSTRPAASQPSRNASAVTAISASAYCSRTSAKHVVGHRRRQRAVEVAVEQRVAHAQQQAARHQEERRVEHGEAQPDGGPRAHQTPVAGALDRVDRTGGRRACGAGSSPSCAPCS